MKWLINNIIFHKTKKGYIKNIDYENKYVLFGGGKKYKVSILNDNYIYFDEIFNNNTRQILLSKTYNEYGKNKKYNCVVITIHNNINTAEIDVIQVKEHKCISFNDFELKNSGYFYLKIAIKMLKKYKDKLNINKIILEDVATVKCNNIEYSLSLFLLLTRGRTFYEKEGFKMELYDKEVIKFKKYFNKVKVNEIDWNRVLKNYKGNVEIKKIINKNRDIYLHNFFGKIFTKENMKTNKEICELYNSIQNGLIMFFINKLGDEMLNIFTTNNKMILEI